MTFHPWTPKLKTTKALSLSLRLSDMLTCQIQLSEMISQRFRVQIRARHDRTETIQRFKHLNAVLVARDIVAAIVGIWIKVWMAFTLVFGIHPVFQLSMELRELRADSERHSCCVQTLKYPSHCVMVSDAHLLSWSPVGTPSFLATVFDRVFTGSVRGTRTRLALLPRLRSCRAHELAAEVF